MHAFGKWGSVLAFQSLFCWCCFVCFGSLLKYYYVKNSILRLQLALYLIQLKHSNWMLLRLSSESFVDYWFKTAAAAWNHIRDSLPFWTSLPHWMCCSAESGNKVRLKLMCCSLESGSIVVSTFEIEKWKHSTSGIYVLFSGEWEDSTCNWNWCVQWKGEIKYIWNWCVLQWKVETVHL